MGFKDDWYVGKAKPRNEWFYDESLRSELLFKARSKSLEVYRWQNEGS